jgi:membrane protein DedA with SNARE-associated domain
MHHLSAFFHDLVLHFGYIGLFLAMVVGNIGVPAGLEVVVPTAGALAGAGHLPGLGPIPAWVVVGAVGVLGELVGNSILYAVGWYGGLPLVRRYGKVLHVSEHEVERVHAFYERYGRATVFWCRFIPFVRGIAALPPGISRMKKRYFLTYTALGSAIFCFGLAYLGNVAGRNVDAIAGYLHDFAIAIVGGLIVIALLAYAVWRRSRARRAAARSKTAV